MRAIRGCVRRDPEVEFIDVYSTCISPAQFPRKEHTITVRHQLFVQEYPELSLPEHQVKMATQRALIVQEIGKPLVLVENHPIREPGHGQVQIKVTVAGKSGACRSQSMHRSGNHEQVTDH
jgi:hypothetical protein